MRMKALKRKCRRSKTENTGHRNGSIGYSGSISERKKEEEKSDFKRNGKYADTDI